MKVLRQPDTEDEQGKLSQLPWEKLFIRSNTLSCAEQTPGELWRWKVELATRSELDCPSLQVSTAGCPECLCDFVARSCWKSELRSRQVAWHWRGPYHLSMYCCGGAGGGGWPLRSAGQRAWDELLMVLRAHTFLNVQVFKIQCMQHTHTQSYVVSVNVNLDNSFIQTNSRAGTLLQMLYP